jgi:hypothetical protein
VEFVTGGGGRGVEWGRSLHKKQFGEYYFLPCKSTVIPSLRDVSNVLHKMYNKNTHGMNRNDLGSYRYQ